MIPIKLMLRNFLSYGDEPETLDFAGLDLFCLVGENGHGKSALLDAMTWALWGTSRATTQDELFHAGSIEMTVTFDYALSGQHYQVMRSRRLMRRTANTLLEFRVERDGEMMPLTGGTVDETEALITKSLGMSYRTFINSAFLLQGRADEFTKKTPSERKQILADVLNMHEFETLERDARNQRREQELLVANLRQHAGTLERQVARAQDVEAEATGAAQALRDADAAVVAAVAADQALRAQREAVRAKEQRLVEVEQDLRDVKTERSARELEKRGYDEQIRQTEHLLAHEHELREGYQRWRLTRQVLDSERAKLERLRPLRDRETVLRMSIERHIDSLQCAAQDLQREQAQQREVVARGTRATTELEGLRRERQELTLREQDCLKTEADATRCATLTATLGATLTTDKKRLAELRDHYRLLLGADAACPVCHTALDSARRQSVYQEMKKQGDELNRKIDEDSRALATTTEQKGIFERAMVLHKEALARIPALERKAGTLEEQVNAGDVAKTRLTVVEHDLQHIDQTLKSGAFLPEEQAELARLPREIAAVGYDQGTHDRLTTEFKELEQFEHALQELEEQRLMRQGALAALERIIMECRRLRRAPANWPTKSLRSMKRSPPSRRLIPTSPPLRPEFANSKKSSGAPPRETAWLKCRCSNSKQRRRSLPKSAKTCAMGSIVCRSWMTL